MRMHARRLRPLWMGGSFLLARLAHYMISQRRMAPTLAGPQPRARCFPAGGARFPLQWRIRPLAYTPGRRFGYNATLVKFGDRLRWRNRPRPMPKPPLEFS